MIHKNMRMREAIRVAEALGATVELNGSGEIRFAFPTPNGQRRFNCHHNRHDTPQVLISYMRKLARK